MAKVTLVGLATLLTICIGVYFITLVHLSSDDRASYDDYLDGMGAAPRFSHPRSHMRRIAYEWKPPLERRTRFRFMANLVEGGSSSTTAAYEQVVKPEDFQITSTTAAATTAPISLADEGVTVVTALLDIGRGKWWYYRRPFDIYLDYLEQMLQLEVNMILFVDKKAIEFARKCRSHLASKTVLYETTLADVPLWRYRDRMTKIIETELKNYRYALC